MVLTAAGKTLDLTTPVVMGVLNVTPDSFADGGRYSTVASAIKRIEQMTGEGAAIIDVGGESSRPGSDPVSLQEELDRTIPVLEQAVKAYPGLFFSIDTTKFEVARAALDTGVHFINDISGLKKEPRLAELAAGYEAGLIIMHSSGEPKTMQQNPVYGNVIDDVYTFLTDQAEYARHKGVKSIIIDPGIGFGKKLEHNLALLSSIGTFALTGYPVLVGASNKSMIGHLLDNRPVEKRLAGTLAVHYDALTKGAKIIRVHDVREAFDSILIYNALNPSL
ncbi:MAG: dihydropteroate synthase [Rhodothermaceae bacterium]|nr:dihydropteroate synthase [Rhodothermaceae bacterium]